MGANLSSGVLTAGWQQALWVLWALTLLPLADKGAWIPLRQPARLNLWCAAIAVVFTLWCIRYSVKPGLALHLMGATILMLMFGPRLAQLALYLVVAAVAATGMAAFDGYPGTALLTGAVPVWVSWMLFRLVERRLPAHIFVFIFGAGFINAALAMAASALATVALHAAAGTYAPGYLTEYYLPYALLLAWGEAFITGMVMALMVVYYPQWVLLFDDARYLARR
jgi:uncharacterized membrane protein